MASAASSKIPVRIGGPHGRTSSPGVAAEHHFRHQPPRAHVGASPAAAAKDAPPSPVKSPPKFEAFVMTGDLMINLATRETRSNLLQSQFAAGDDKRFHRRRRQLTAPNLHTSSIPFATDLNDTRKPRRESAPTATTTTSLPTSPTVEAEPSFTGTAKGAPDQRNAKRLSRSEDQIGAELSTVDLDTELNNQSTSLDLLITDERDECLRAREPRLLPADPMSASDSSASSATATSSSQSESQSSGQRPRSGTFSKGAVVHTEDDAANNSPSSASNRFVHFVHVKRSSAVDAHTLTFRTFSFRRQVVYSNAQLFPFYFQLLDR